MIPSVVALLLIAGVPDLDPALSKIIETLESSGGLARALEEDVAVWVDTDPPGTQTELCRLVRGLLIAHLERLGHKAILGLSEVGADEDESARRRGAEWVIAVRIGTTAPDELSLRAELRPIDRGLWSPLASGSIRAFASGRARAPTGFDRTYASPGPAEPMVWELRRLKDTVLSMASCPGRADTTERLVVLGTRLLEVFTLSEAGAERTWSLSLDSLPPSAVRSRDPIGRVICADLDRDSEPEIAFGSSQLSKGYVLGRRSPSGGLVIVREISGIPLGVVGKDLILAHADSGTNRWRMSEDATPYLDLQLLDARVFALRPDFRWTALGGTSPKVLPMTGGVGGAALADAQPPAFVTTSSRAWSGPDRLRLVDAASGRPLAADISTPGPIRASAPLGSADGVLRIAVAVRSAQAQESLILLVHGPKEASPR